MDSPCVIAHQGKSASLCPLSLLHKSRRKSVNFHCHARVQPDMHDFAAVQENLIVGLIAVALEVNHPVRVLVKVSFLNGQVIQLRGLPGSEECPRIIVLRIRPDREDFRRLWHGLPGCVDNGCLHIPVAPDRVLYEHLHPLLRVLVLYHFLNVRGVPTSRLSATTLDAALICSICASKLFMVYRP